MADGFTLYTFPLPARTSYTGCSCGALWTRFLNRFTADGRWLGVTVQCCGCGDAIVVQPPAPAAPEDGRA